MTRDHIALALIAVLLVALAVAWIVRALRDANRRIDQLTADVRNTRRPR